MVARPFGLEFQMLSFCSEELPAGYLSIQSS